MASLQTAGSASGPPSPATRVPLDRSVPARVAADGTRRNIAEDGSDGMRSVDGDATNGGGRGRGIRHEEAERGAVSEEDGDNDESKVDSDSARRGPLSSDEFALISVPLDTWVGRYVRITTPRHNGTTGLVHRTGNGWVNLQTAVGDVAKRAYDLVVIPEERASIGNGVGGMGKGETSRGKRYRGPKGGQASMGSNSGSGDDRKPSASRGRNPRGNHPTAHSSSDSSGQDDNEEDGDEHDNGRSNRRRGRATMDDCSDFDDADLGDEDDEDGDNDDDRYDDGKGRNARGGRAFPGALKGRSVMKGGRDKGDRYGTGEPVKSSGRMSITYTRRDGGGGAGKPRGRVGEQDKMRERDRVRERGDPSKAGVGRERDGMKGDGFMPIGRGKDKEAEWGSRAKRRDLGSSHALPGDLEDKQASGYRERGERSRDKLAPAPNGKKDEAVIKPSWVTQMQKAKERPNLVHWRDELVAITKDSTEDFEDATLSVELMRVRCDVCYHEKSDGDKFCWNEDCWLSPVFGTYCKTDADEASPATPPKSPSQEHTGYMNSFGRETIIDYALTSALQAPVKWLETKRKRKLEAHEVFSEDPALYRWQCWASTCADPNSKDPTFVEDPRFKTFDSKRSRTGAAGQTRHVKSSPDGKRFGSRSNDKFGDHERGTKAGLGGKANSSAHIGAPGIGDGGIEAASPMGVIGGASGAMDEVPVSRKAGRSSQDDPRVSAYANENVREMDAAVDAGDMRMEVGSGMQGIPRRGDVGRPWS